MNTRIQESLFSEDNASGRVRVCLPLNLDRCFDYMLPHNVSECPIGSYVRVHFSGRMVIGVVWEIVPQHEPLPEKALKPVNEVLTHLPPMHAALRQLIEKTARYYCASLGNCLKLAMPQMESLREAEVEEWVMLYHQNVRQSEARQRVFSLLKEGAQPKAHLLESGVLPAVLKGLAEAGAIRYMAQQVMYPRQTLKPQHKTLTEEQQQAATMLISAAHSGFQPFLLDGATGSGKTEVFFEAAEAVMQQGKQVLILLPEIALSLQVKQRAEQRFGITPIIWHSSETPARRRDALRRIMSGAAPLVIGARSALYLPYQELGMIVVDEEHDSSFKQEDGVMYYARDMAILRARLEQIPVVLASATPSLETVFNVQQNKYQEITLHRRTGQAELPKVQLVDMRKETLPVNHWISSLLKHKIEQTMLAGKQSLLFINRRGYAPLTLCRSCGHRYECPSCTAWLVYHTDKRQLQCHHCGLSLPLPSSCPSCGADKEKLAMCGPGVERLEEEVRLLFPHARSLMLSGDVHSTQQLQERLAAIAAGEADIIIGTQLLAKGHHFPKLALVGVVDGDAGLQGGDVRGAEKTYQLLHQLAGRAGREKERGEVLIQTYRPDAPLMEALTRWDREGFIALEMEARHRAAMPPYGRLAALIIEGKPEHDVELTVKALMQTMPNVSNVQILGAAPAPLYKLRNLYRYRFLIIGGRRTALQPMLNVWREGIKRPSGISIRIDIDPVSFM